VKSNDYSFSFDTNRARKMRAQGRIDNESRRIARAIGIIHGAVAFTPMYVHVLLLHNFIRPSNTTCHDKPKATTPVEHLNSRR
jgi:hypothetical protein